MQLTWKEMATRGARDEAGAHRHGHTATTLSGRIYIYGGRAADKTYLNSIAILDTESLVWKVPPIREVPPARGFHTADAVDSSRMIVFGGVGSEGASFFNDVWLFVADKAEWSIVTVAGEPPPQRAAHTSVLRGAARGAAPSLFVFGGTNTQRCFADLWSLSIASARWDEIRTSGTKPSARSCAPTRADRRHLSQ